ncbi:hypothetical protein D1007_39055 [Hordeum vulgare]|nr:hypothetical protein D1007_39055 [Hordeum vulgare]
MLRLRAAGLTIEMAGSDFLVRRIAPLQDRALRMGVCWSCRCHANVKFILPPSIILLCNNSLKDAIVAMMPACNVHGVDPMWRAPTKEVVQAWFDDLTEACVRDEGSMILATIEGTEIQ